MSTEHERLNELFSEALGKASPEERERYLAEACGPDRELRRQVDSLLLAHTQSGGFLRQSVVATSGPPIGEGLGSVIGRYKLLQQIGEGGFGVVFMAEQQEPVRRMVALKIIKAGMDTHEVVARFEAERQALALMDHPNIARVLDGGTTASGRPYFVMDLVKGIPITEFCEQHQLPTEARLQLFMKVCAGVQHAHQKGIIHRDLKPTNVLVTLHDGEPVPKVIDFGIAKAIGQKLTERTLFTRFEQLIGTPAYMSPEQAEWSGLDIDTRSDLYSLGVLLYELLTGTTPLEKDALARAALEEVRRMIRESDPPKPSTRLTAIVAADGRRPASKSEMDGASLRQRLQAVRGDLDWIVMKALEKDRTRRYETVNALTRDIERHLDGEPVVACPPSKTYRAGKFIRKHRVAVAAVAGVVGVLVIGLAVSIGFFIQERKAHDRAVAAERQQSLSRAEAEAERTKAQNEAAKSRQVAQFLKEMLKGAGPSVALGRDTTMLREILDKTAERAGKELKNQPQVEADLRNTLGQVYDELGEYDKAGEMHREALALRRSLLGNEHLDVAESLRNLASVLYSQGKPAEAEAMHREALALRRSLLGNEHLDVAESLTGLALVLHDQGKLAEAEALDREALAMRKKLLGEEHPDVANSLNNLGGVLRDEGKLAEAEATHREALAMRKRLLGEEHPDVANSLNNLGLVLLDEGKHADAEAAYRDVLRLARKMYGTHPYVAFSLHNLSCALLPQKKHEEAETLEREALAIARAMMTAEQSFWAESLQHLALVLQSEGKLAEAEPLARESLAIRQSRAPDDWLTAVTRSTLGDILLQQKAYAAAEPLLLSGYEGLQQRERNAGLSKSHLPKLKETLEGLVQLYEATDRPTQAAEWRRKLAEFNKATPGKMTPPSR